MDVLERVLEVFTAIGNWISTAITSLIPIFYTAPTGTETSGSLTFIGVLAVAGLGFAVIFLMMRVISNFLHFRG